MNVPTYPALISALVEPEKLAEIGKLTDEDGLTPLEALEVVRGFSTVAQIYTRRQLDIDSEKWTGVPSEEWPPFEIIWDLDEANFHYALGSDSVRSFAADYPDVKVWIADVADIIASLHVGAQRILPPWDEAYAGRTARLVAWWAAGHRVTPPLVVPCERQICFAGGNHRFAVAREKGLGSIPVLVEARSLDNVQRNIPSLKPAI